MLRTPFFLIGLIALLPAGAMGTKIITRKEPVLAEIQRTGMLKVAIRRDAAPFGYLNQAGEWDGYCHDVAISLQNYLSTRLEQPLQLVELTSSLENRFSLVRDRIVHLECGPNTIRQDLEGVRFSEATYVSSAYFLTQQDTALDPASSLEGVKIGVLSNTTTEQFLETTYPDAELVRFQGPNGRADAVYAVTEDRLDAFVGDGVLTLSEMAQQNLPIQDYTLVPERPLTCEFYGLVLPDDDYDWQSTIDDFLASNAEDTVWNNWFGEAIPYVVNLYEDCISR